jgi:AcrR family transcriptional regulator
MARPRKFDEAQVVRAARDQFWSAGYAGTSLDDLQDVTGLGRGSLYGAFGDKHTLFMRVFDDYCTDAVAGVREQLRAPGSAYEHLVAHIRTVADAVAADCEHRGCMLAKGTAELASVDAEVARRAQRAFTQLHQVVADTIRDAQREGDLDPNADAEQLAAALLALLRGIEAIGKGGIDPALIRAIATQATALLPRAKGLESGFPDPERP